MRALRHGARGAEEMVLTRQAMDLAKALLLEHKKRRPPHVEPRLEIVAAADIDAAVTEGCRSY